MLLALNHGGEQAQVVQARRQLGIQQAQIAADEAALRSAQARATNLARPAGRVADLAARGAETTPSRDDAQTDLATQQQEVARL